MFDFYVKLSGIYLMQTCKLAIITISYTKIEEVGWENG